MVVANVRKSVFEAAILGVAFGFLWLRLAYWNSGSCLLNNVLAQFHYYGRLIEHAQLNQ